MEVDGTEEGADEGEVCGEVAGQCEVAGEGDPGKPIEVEEVVGEGGEVGDEECSSGVSGGGDGEGPGGQGAPGEP